jgi:hypothetical protein
MAPPTGRHVSVSITNSKDVDNEYVKTFPISSNEPLSGLKQATEQAKLDINQYLTRVIEEYKTSHSK